MDEKSASIRLVPDSAIVHSVHPEFGREHVIDGNPCWCEPHLYRLCGQCEGNDPACWKCDGSGIVRVEAILPGDRAMIVHHFIPDDATITLRED